MRTISKQLAAALVAGVCTFALPGIEASAGGQARGFRGPMMGGGRGAAWSGAAAPSRAMYGGGASYRSGVVGSSRPPVFTGSRMGSYGAYGQTTAGYGSTGYRTTGFREGIGYGRRAGYGLGYAGLGYGGGSGYDAGYGEGYNTGYGPGVSYSDAGYNTGLGYGGGDVGLGGGGLVGGLLGGGADAASSLSYAPQPAYAAPAYTTTRTYAVPTTVYRPVTSSVTVPVRSYRTLERTRYVPVTTAVRIPVTTYQTYQRTVQVPTTVYRPVRRTCNCSYGG